MSQDVDVTPVEEETKPVETQESLTGEEKPVVILTEEQVQQEVSKRIEDLFAATNAWKEKEELRFAIQFPTGQTALVKYMDMLDLVSVDLVEELDIFQKRLFPRELDEQGRPIEYDSNKNLYQLLKEPESRVKFLDMTNRLFSVAVLKPIVINDGVALMTREDGTRYHVFGHKIKDVNKEIELFGAPVPELKEGQVYAGSINLQDRMALYSELNKPMGLIEPFRESEIRLESVASSESIGTETE